MVIGGEDKRDGPAGGVLTASTEPPMVIGGERVLTSGVDLSPITLQRSRRW